MGKALYRKYRSKSLDDIVGQKHITDTLKHALEKDAISHAYLFTGPRGTGKTSVARILAHEINKIPYDDEATHLDIIEIDAASNRRIDEIRDLRDKVHIAPTSSKYKVYIIDEVHMLTREAFNALLKTLEEPPEHAVFILATTELHKVPETIVSRTQKYTFRLYNKAEITGHLRIISDAEKISITDKALDLLADHGRGSFRDSISMLDQIAGFSYDEITHEHVARLLGVPSSNTMQSIVEAVGSNDSQALFVATASLREQGAQSSRTAQALITLLREQLAKQGSPLPDAQAVTLMKELLPLTAGNSSSEALEIALLDAMTLENMPLVHEPMTKSAKTTESIANPTKVPAKALEVKTKNDPVITVANDSITKTKEDESSIVTTVTNDTVETEEPQALTKSPKIESTDAWQEVLTNVKLDNGTLHGILRMAEISVSDDTISLAFQFAFHKSQLSKPANMKSFMSYVEKAYGGKRKLIMDVQTKTASPPKPTKAKSTSAAINPTSEKTNADLKNISNIFGDAELLD